MKWYLEGLKKYAVFKGRARRKEYWLFTLCDAIITIALLFIGVQIIESLIPFSIYWLGTVIPSTAIIVRRLHDSGKSGWSALILLIPAIGGIILLVFMCQDSTPGENKYGPNPKEVAAT